MEVPRSSGNVLAQPTRARIFAWLAEHGSAIGTVELASRLGLHPNGVRRHLERLHQAGLVERRRSRGKVGRPGDRWLVAADAYPGGERSSGYNELPDWLARAIPAGPGRLREIERAGREVGRELAPTASDDAVESFRRVVDALGFQPTIDVEGDEGFTCRLGNCPYRSSVRENQTAICGLHRGITEGLLEGLQPDAKLGRFEPQDPDRAGCVIEVVTTGRR